MLSQNIQAKRLAIKDIQDGLKQWRTWALLAYQDIKLRYRRSVLGPFWITLSMGITVFTMGYLYSHLFHINVDTYFPYLTASILAWTLISNLLTDSMETFTTAEGLLKQVKLPYSLYIYRVVTRNLLIFFHNIIVLIPVLLIFHSEAGISWSTLFILPALLLLYINGVSFGLMFGMLGARFRDLAQVIKSLIQVIFFVTPVMWRADILPKDKQFIINLNPFHSVLEIIRAPLLGQSPQMYHVLVSLGVTVFGITCCYYMFSIYRARIIYWI